MDRPFIAENDRELKRLRALFAQLTAEELMLPLGEDWTVAVALAHLAFWDERSLVLLRKWKMHGVASSPIDVDVTNDCLLAQWRAMPPRTAANLAVLSAQAVDRELASAPPELIQAIRDLGEDFRLFRSIHRKLHLDQIEAVLKKSRATLQI
jgi:hypothetical protein